MNITMEDISARMRSKGVIENYSPSINVKSLDLYTNKGAFNESNAFQMINNWTQLSENTNIAFSKALDVFSEICKNCTYSKINDAYYVLLQEEGKVRDASQLQNSIKYKTSRLKSKISTKIQNRIDDASDNLIAKINDMQNKLKSPLPSSTPVNRDTTEEEYLNKLYDNAKAIAECDRIINNYGKVCKRFDIDKIISEINTDEDIYDAINEICICIDTYNIPFVNKYNSSLESVFYALNKNYINYSLNKIVETVTDYYIFNTTMNESEFKDIKKISEISPIFESSAFDGISFLYENKTQSDSINIISPEYNVTDLLEGEIKNQIKSDVKSIRKDMKEWPKGNPEEHKDDDIKKMIEDFRSQCAKTDKDDTKVSLISHFKALINKMYTKNPDQIVNETPKLLTLIRMTFIISTCAINAALGLVALITDLIIKMALSRKQTEKIINAYKKEIDNTKTKLNKTKDSYTRERLEKYKTELNKDLEKLKMYDNNLYTDDENEERHKDDEYEFDDDFDFDFGNTDDDFGLSESQLINCATIEIISQLMESLYKENITNVNALVENNIHIFDENTLDAITDFSIIVPSILSKSKLHESFVNYRQELRESDNLDYIRIDTINENLYKIETSNDAYNINSDTKSMICSLMWLNELAKVNNIGYVNEMNITNTLKLALNRLKNNAIKLSDKEKQMSNNIDVAVSNMSKGIEKAMMNDSREAIIRGSILPSASKTIKIALALGVEWAINPALSVITALGAFACQKRLSAKERQLALDDIEIELKMCERYMRQAEEKNDMKAIRQIEQIQRNLQRQQQRIKYRMKVLYKQDVPNVVGEDD